MQNSTGRKSQKTAKENEGGKELKSAKMRKVAKGHNRPVTKGNTEKRNALRRNTKIQLAKKGVDGERRKYPQRESPIKQSDRGSPKTVMP